MNDDPHSAPDWRNPATVYNPEGQGPAVLICEHAGNQVPGQLANLGLRKGHLDSHIGWDIGTAAVARQIATLLDSPLIMQRFSRLVIDCNRPADSIDAIVERSDNVVIPGNLTISDEHRRSRYEKIYLPFHSTVRRILDEQTQVYSDRALVTVHSFTPVLNGRNRRLDLGILHDVDRRLADRLLSKLDEESSWICRRNEPYGPDDGVTYTLKEHAISRGLQNVMFEIRNTLILDSQGQQEWAMRLAMLLSEALSWPLHAFEDCGAAT